ncbi:MAG: hypothetical protein IT376_11885 [Polyangiaceae bacterium]|nr:hypothetical protein [Polyangiaceae bacterium]
MRRPLTSLTLATLVTACGGGRPGGAGAPEPAPQPSAAEASARAGDAPPPPAPAEPPVEAAREEPPPPDPAADPPPPSPIDFDLDDWAHRRGLKLELQVDRCEPARLGKEADTLLFCWRREPRKDDWVLHHQGLYAVRAGKLARVWELPIGAEPLTAAGEKERPLVRLQVEAHADGASVTVGDSEPSCAAASAHVREVATDDAAGAKPLQALVKRVCDGVGKYRLVGDTLVRAR